jgi:hypothetical protein
MSKRTTQKQNEVSNSANQPYHFTLPQSILNAKTEWLNGSRNISSYEKALAMIVFGQMMKTGASINGWWWGTNPDHNVGPQSSHPNHIIFFKTAPATQNVKLHSPVVEPTNSLRKLELMFENIS